MKIGIAHPTLENTKLGRVPGFGELRQMAHQIESAGFDSLLRNPPARPHFRWRSPDGRRQRPMLARTDCALCRFVEHAFTGLVARGTEGIILGCTEIGLLVRDEDSSVPLFDTTRIHAVAVVMRALAVA